jgi:hypothetical protein
MKEQDFLHCLLLQLKIRQKLWMQDQEAASEEIKLSPYLILQKWWMRPCNVFRNF